VGGLIVVCDACVLYPAPLRDLLLQLATADLFQARWSNAIHDEWMRNVLKDRPDLTREQLQRTRLLMDRTAADSLVEGYESLIGAVHQGIDAKDRHVVAVAIHSHARVIVTFNFADFPAEALAAHEMEAQHPDDFLMRLDALNPGLLPQAAKAVRARLRNPPVTAADYIDTIQRQRLPAVAATLRAAEASI
jgi:predicted nucleic acid-binding protein